MSIELSKLSVEELEALAASVAAELAGRREAQEPVLRRILCRKKDLNARGNGAQVTRRVRLPSGETGWASDLAQDVDGSWENGSYLASQRRCGERGKVPVGTVVLEYESSLRGGQKTGRATISAGVVGEDESKTIDWGLSTRGKGTEVDVKLPTGEWVRI